MLIFRLIILSALIFAGPRVGGAAAQEGVALVNLRVPPYEVIYDARFVDDPQADPDGAGTRGLINGPITLVSLVNTNPTLINTLTIEAVGWRDGEGRHVQSLTLDPGEAIVFSPASTTELEKGRTLPENVPFSEGRLKLSATEGIVGMVTTTWYKDSVPLNSTHSPLTAQAPQDPLEGFTLYLPYYKDDFHLGADGEEGELTLISLVNAHPFSGNTITLEYTSWQDPPATETQTLTLAPGQAALFSPASTSDLEQGTSVPNVSFKDGRLKVSATAAVVGYVFRTGYMRGNPLYESGSNLASESQDTWDTVVTE